MFCFIRMTFNSSLREMLLSGKVGDPLKKLLIPHLGRIYFIQCILFTLFNFVLYSFGISHDTPLKIMGTLVKFIFSKFCVQIIHFCEIINFCILQLIEHFAILTL